MVNTKPMGDALIPFEVEPVKCERIFKPKVVLGCWVTQKYRASDGPGTGSMFGTNEERIIERVDEYIHVGNKDIHAKKRICAKPHEAFQFPWLVSRSIVPEQDVIYVWKKT